MQGTVSGALCFVRSCVKSLNPWENLRQVELLTIPFANKETGTRKSNNRRACLLSHFSRVQLCATLWTVARQAPLSMGFSRQEY